jgi:hypothetical protein
MQRQVALGDSERVLNDRSGHPQATVLAEYGPDRLTLFDAMWRGIFKSHLAQNTKDIVNDRC